MSCRKDVKDLNTVEKAAFVQALIDLKHAPSQISAAQADGGQGRYDDFVWIHNQVRGAAHNAPAFTPWHREFLYQLENELKAISGNPDFTIPYWDWTKAQSSSDPGWPFTNDFLGGLGTSAADSRVTTGRFATDPANPSATEWRINILDVETDNYLKRRGIAPEFNLPTLSQAQTAMEINVYDAVPYVITTNLTNAQLNASFRKFLEFILHNGPHPWVGLQPQFNSLGNLTNAPLVGSMSWQASPNDPAFWLHHCNIDRLWAIWQQRHSYPGYIPQSGGSTLQNGPNVMGMYNDPSFFNFPQHTTPNSNENHKALNYSYFSDVPEISAPMSPSINFGDVPEGLTTYKPVQFNVTTCQAVKFRITAIGGAGYSNPYPGAHTVNGLTDDDPFIADVYVAFQAPGGGSGPFAGSVTVQAFINDPDRLLVSAAAPSDEYIIGTWTVSMNANVVPRPQSAVVLALDRSGSMSLPVGGGLRRFDLLEEAVQVVSDIMRDSDGMGLVYYDHNVIRRMNITPMTASSGKAQVASALADPTLEPSGGSTAIGSGMIEAADVLTDEMGTTGTPYSRFAMLVMTDGNENVRPYANESSVTSAIASFSDDVYAVGLGHEGEVSEATLGAIANYMLITGDMDADEREFRLTKYFVQILAGITNMDIVVDPTGQLTLGIEHRIEFDLSSADIETDIIVLSPLAFLIDMKLEAPDGSVLTPATIGLNGTFHRNMKDIFYRLHLPVLPAKPDGTHSGRWTAILSVSKDRIKEIIGKLDNFPKLLERLRRGVIPYTLTIHSYSNVSFDVRIEQTSLTAGAKLQLFAYLNQYKAPLTHSARVRVEITRPNRTVSLVELYEQEAGSFYGEYQTTITGVYHCRFLAYGNTLEGDKFTREQDRTATTYRHVPTPSIPTDGDDNAKSTICRIIDCLLNEQSIQELLKRYKIDPIIIHKCFGEACKSNKKLSLIQGINIMKKEIDKQTGSQELSSNLAQRLAPLLRETGMIKVIETPEPKKVKAAPEQEISMNPLGGMWPVVETKKGEFQILLKTDKGKLDPPPGNWKEEKEDKKESRKIKLSDALLDRLKNVSKKGKSNKRK